MLLPIEGVSVVPSVHFLIRQAARERLAAVRVISEESRQRHLAMAEIYTRRAEELRNGIPDPSQAGARFPDFSQKRTAL
jgi:hypothetical protein